VGKGYKGKTCVYCAVDFISDTEDHVLAKKFFPEAQRANLPKVPACTSCNRAKAGLEHYLATVLPFAGRHPDAGEVLSSMVPRRLAKNRKLHSQLSSSLGQAWLKDGATLRPATTLLLDADQLKGLVRYFVRGLAAYHWDLIIPAVYRIGVGVWTNEGEQLVASALPKSGKATIEGSWGNRAFEYRGLQAEDDPNLTLWKFEIYGGVLLAGDSNLAPDASPRIWAISSSSELPELFEY
jgi:hypothetical protein